MEKLKDFTHGGNIYKASRETKFSKSEIIDYSANINPLGLSPKGKLAIKKSASKILNYPDPDYYELISSISDYYNVSKDYVCPGNGAIELIYAYARMKKGGRALIPAPGFVEYERALLLNSWDISFYTDKNEIDTEEYNVIFICNPNNPTGKSFSRSFLISLLENSKRNNCDIFIDEAFIEFSSYSSLADEIKKHQNLFILKSLTKFFAIPGLRLGALLTSNKFFREQHNYNKVPWNINVVAEEYIKAATKDKKYIKKTKLNIKKERKWLYNKLINIDNLKVFRTQGNYLFIQNLSNADLCKELLKLGIMIRSCHNYNNLDSSYYRIAVKKRQMNKLLIKKIKRILNN